MKNSNRLKETTTVKDSSFRQNSFEEVQSDHEAFLQAFEKPTQIYRYLRTRSLISPIFLHRNLSYFQKRTTKIRKTHFRIDSLLESLSSQLPVQIQCIKSQFLNLTFLSVSHPGLAANLSATVHVSLKKCSTTLKGFPRCSSHLISSVIVPCNIRNSWPSGGERISLAASHFDVAGRVVESFVLSLKVDFDPQEGNSNGIEKRKTRRSSTPDPANNAASVEKLQSEMDIYDRYRQCLLDPGDYELALHQDKAQGIWETMSESQSKGPFHIMNSNPILRFRLDWSSDVTDCKYSSSGKLHTHSNRHNNNNHVMTNGHHEESSEAVQAPERIFFQFLYANKTKQQTEMRRDLTCPWCMLHCQLLYSLLKHLRTCHSRFLFSYSNHPQGSRIDVSINEMYDGSYETDGSDQLSQLGYAYFRQSPVHCTPATSLICFRPRKPTFSLTEFMEAEQTVPYPALHTKGHMRLYYHTSTAQAITAQEIDYDSEDETDPQWLRQKTINMIQDFTDVNDGEKEIMTMWNLHIMEENYIGDCQLQDACWLFVEKYGHKFIEKNIVGNFFLHLANLYDYGLISPSLIVECHEKLKTLRSGLADGV